MGENPWYSFYVGDYSRKTAHLSMLEHGAYRLLLDHYYAMRDPLPNDMALLFRICRAHTPTERRAVTKIVGKYFTVDDNVIRNKRCDAEITKLLNYSNRQSAAAKLRHSHGIKPSVRGGQQDSEGSLALKSSDPDYDNNLIIITSPSATALPRARVPQPQSDKEERKKVLGTRFALSQLPDDWKLFCIQERQDLDPEGIFLSFRDYWIAVPGQKGIKLDWFATWRNWIRNQKGDKHGNARQISEGISKPNKDERARAAVLRAAERLGFANKAQP